MGLITHQRTGKHTGNRDTVRRVEHGSIFADPIQSNPK